MAAFLCGVALSLPLFFAFLRADLTSIPAYAGPALTLAAALAGWSLGMPRAGQGAAWMRLVAGAVGLGLWIWWVQAGPTDWWVHLLTVGAACAALSVFAGGAAQARPGVFIAGLAVGLAACAGGLPAATGVGVAVVLSVFILAAAGRFAGGGRLSVPEPDSRDAPADAGIVFAAATGAVAAVLLRNYVPCARSAGYALTDLGAALAVGALLLPAAGPRTGPARGQVLAGASTLAVLLLIATHSLLLHPDIVVSGTGAMQLPSRALVGGRIFPLWVLAALAGAAAAPALTTGPIGAMAAAAGAAAGGLLALSYVGAAAAAAGLCLLAVFLACHADARTDGVVGSLAAVCVTAGAAVVLLAVPPHAGWRPLRVQLSRGKALSEREAASLRLDRAELRGQGPVVWLVSGDLEATCVGGDVVALRGPAREASGTALRLLTVLPAAYAGAIRTVGLVAPVLEETRRGAALIWGEKLVHALHPLGAGGKSQSDVIIVGPGALSGVGSPLRVLGVEALRNLRAQVAPGGVLALYLPAGWVPPETLRRALSAFAEVFGQFDLYLAREEAVLVAHSSQGPGYTGLQAAFAGRQARRWLREGGLWQPIEPLLAFVAAGEELRGPLCGAAPLSLRAPGRPPALGRDLSAPMQPVSLAALAQYRLAGPGRVAERLRTQQGAQRAVVLRGFASVYEATTCSTLEAVGRTGPPGRERLVEFLRGPLARLDLLAPGEAERPVRLAAAMTALGMRDQAVELLQQAAAAGQDSYAVRMRLVEALAAAQEMEEALEHCRRALELRPDSVEALRRMAALLLATGRAEPAAQALERAIQQAPDSAVDMLMLAKLRTQAGDLEAAADLARRALQVAPGNPDAQFLLEVLGGRTDSGSQRAGQQPQTSSGESP